MSLSEMKTYQSFTRPYMSLCGRDEDGTLCQLQTWAHCRETLIGHVCNKHKPGPYSARCELLATDKTRVILYAKQTARTKALREEKRLAFERTLENAVKILNFFEKEGDLKLSKLYQIEHPLAPSNFAYLVEGSAEWQRAPSLLSLYLLLIRCGRFSELGNFTTFDEFMERCAFVIKDFEKHTKNVPYYQRARYPSDFPEGSVDDPTYLKFVADKLLVIMKNRKKLFSKTTAKEHYKDCRVSDGIYNLCRGGIKDTNLSRHFIEVCDSYEIESDKPFM